MGLEQTHINSTKAGQETSQQVFNLLAQSSRASSENLTQHLQVMVDRK